VNADVAIEIAGGRLIVASPIHSPKALRASLRALEAAEIVVRHDMSGIVLHVEYDFAENMRPTKSRRNNK
jgi:DNA-binding HxlR family transcriptional regulator